MRFLNLKLHKIFIFSILLKGINAGIEIVGGILFFFTGTLADIIQFFVRGELAEDPSDLVANSIQQYLPYFFQHSRLFAAFYLLSHGIIKLILVASLLRNKLWAYPSAIFVFFLFIAYQLYRFTYTHSVFLILLTIFDFFIIWLTWHEYKALQK